MKEFLARRWKLLLVVFNVLLVAGAALIIINHKLKTATVDILVAPIEATVKLNGRAYENQRSYDLRPGKYTAEISYDGLESKKVEFTLEKNSFYRLREYLTGKDGDLSFYKKNDTNYEVFREIAQNNDKLADFIKTQDKALALRDELPIEISEYTEGFQSQIWYIINFDTSEKDCDKAACIVITDLSGGSEQAAKNLLVSKGYRLEDYKIKYQVGGNGN